MTAAEAGSSLRTPLVVDRDDLDLSRLRAHCKAMHSRGWQGKPMPRSNRDLAAWHWNAHWRLNLSHTHRPAENGGPPWIMVRDRYGRTVGQTPRPRGWYTGEAPLTREQAAAEFRRRAGATGQ